MEADHSTLRTRTGGPGEARIAGQSALAAARADEHEAGIGGVDRDLAGEGILEIADGREGPAPVATDLQPAAGGGVDHVAVGRMEAGPTLGVGAQLGLVDHPPVVAAIFGDVGGTHVAVEHHEVRVGRRDRRREHAPSAG